MKKFRLLLLLAMLLAGCSTALRVTEPHTVAVTYNDNVTEFITTKYRYPTGQLVYVHECSCDGIVRPIKDK